MSPFAGEGLDVTPLDEPGGIRLVVRGTIDIATTPTLERALRGAERRSPRAVLLDLRALEFIDAAGLRTVIGAARRAARSGIRVALVDPAPHVRRLLVLTGVDRSVEVLKDGQSARAA